MSACKRVSLINIRVLWLRHQDIENRLFPDHLNEITCVYMLHNLHSGIRQHNKYVQESHTTCILLHWLQDNNAERYSHSNCRPDLSCLLWHNRSTKKGTCINLLRRCHCSAACLSISRLSRACKRNDWHTGYEQRGTPFPLKLKHRVHLTEPVATLF